jgi:CRP-like cAMP-binding protein
MKSPSLRVVKSNRLLAALPKSSLDRIVPDLRLQSLKSRQVLQPRGRHIEEVVFPVLGVASMISLGDAGEVVEVATIGCEGMVGLTLLLSREKAVTEVVVQVPGHGLHLSAAAFHYHIEREPPLLRILLRYTQALITQVAQSSACNSHHAAEARCARWLLQTHDRVNGDEFQLTQDYLGLMLGVRRATVTQVAGALQKRGLIRYRRGVITVLNRKGLEAASCHCYELIDAEFHRMLGPSRRSSAKLRRNN